MSNAGSDKTLTPTWMRSLIKAQAFMDGGVRLAVRHESMLRGEMPACREMCSVCCSAREPRATAVEMAGALSVLMKDPALEAAEALRRFRVGDSDGCPFLVGGTCRVHASRPLSCRRLVVFGRTCLPDEDPWRSRGADLLTPLFRHSYRAYSLLLPHLGEHPSQEISEIEPMLRKHLKPSGEHDELSLSVFLDDRGRHKFGSAYRAA